jgi:hypothetical protein
LGKGEIATKAVTCFVLSPNGECFLTDDFYEWKTLDNGHKQPYRIVMKKRRATPWLASARAITKITTASTSRS